MMFWLTSDEHYNHENILKLFVYRKFRSVGEMNLELRDRHNSRVKPGDTVFHLGDFKVSANGPTAHELKAALNGNHVFIQGNHDKNNGCNTPLRFAVIETYSRKVVLTHKPEDADILMDLLSINLAFVGHVHEKWKFKVGTFGDMINVGVDQWDYYPIDAKQIFKAYSNWLNKKGAT